MIKLILRVILLVTFFSCSNKPPKICEIKLKFNSVTLKTRSNDCGKEKLQINKKKELEFIYNELCKSNNIFILNKQGDIWYIDLYIDGLDKKLLSLTKTVNGTYYFRDKLGTYSNDKLAKRIANIMEVECGTNNGNVLN